MLPLLAATVIFLDPGHHSAAPGATSAHGKQESVFNQEMVALLAAALQEADPRLV